MKQMQIPLKVGRKNENLAKKSWGKCKFHQNIAEETHSLKWLQKNNYQSIGGDSVPNFSKI